jgi:hypothetical protein
VGQKRLAGPSDGAEGTWPVRAEGAILPTASVGALAGKVQKKSSKTNSNRFVLGLGAARRSFNHPLVLFLSARLERDYLSG